MVDEITREGLQTATDTFYAALAQALNGHAQPMVDLWSEADDVCYLGPMGGILVGGAAVAASWKEFATTELGGTVTPSDLHFVAAGRIGVVTGREEGIGHRDLPGTVHIRATSTYRLEAGAIKMIGHHTDLITT